MLKNMKIGKKLISTFALVVVITAIAGIVGLVRMMALDTNYTYALNNYGFSQGDVGNLHAEFNALRSTLKDLMLYTDSENILSTSDKINESSTLVSKYLATMQKTMLIQKNSAIIRILRTHLQSIMRLNRK